MIGPGTTIRGNIAGEEDLVVEGRVEGAVRLTKDLTVAEGATVEAEVEARAVRVGGRFAGTLDAGDSLVVEAGAVFVGDVKTPRLQIADGAHFKGKVDMDFDLPGETKKRDDRRR